MNSEYSGYPKLLNELATRDIRIVDKSAQTIRVEKGSAVINDSELSGEAENVIEPIFEGKVTTGEDFSSLPNKPSIMVGAPVFAGDQQVIAAVL